MEGEHTVPDWYQNIPAFKNGKKKPTKITKDMELVTTYGVNGQDMIAYFFVSTAQVNSSAFICPPGHHLEPPGVHCNDEVYYVVKGTVTVSNPDTGEAVRVKEGNALVIPKGTLHIVDNFSEESLYVLCFIHRIWNEKEWQKLQQMVAVSKQQSSSGDEVQQEGDCNESSK